jgi:D-arginine dehydrogenase
MEDFAVAIFGAGIAGASLAWRLAPRCRVLLLESETQPGLHATGRSAAMFMESYGPPSLRALTRASRGFYEDPPAGFSSDPLLAERGVLYVASPGQEALLERTHEELSHSGVRLERVDADEALRRVPCLRRDCVQAALWEPDARDIDVNALHQGFLRGFRRNGGVLRTGARLQRARHHGAAWQLMFADGSQARAQRVVNAAGAWADELAAVLGAQSIGLQPRRRSAFTFRPPTGLDASRWPTVVGVDESYYFKPDAGRLLGSPANADPSVPQDVRPEELDIATGIHRIESVTTLAIRRPDSTWAGLRTFAPDGDVVIGWDDACPRFFWLAGQGGCGIQSAAGASALAAALLLDEAIPDELLHQGVQAHAVSPRRLLRQGGAAP